MSSRYLFLVATSSWFLAFGMQSVVFAWLVTMVLRQPAELVGLAQTALLLPGMLLMLVAGVVADRMGADRQAMWAQSLAAVVPWVLIAALYFGFFSYEMMLVFALLMGAAQAFVTPARDGLLNHVAGSKVQHTVLLASLCQFSFQIVGYGIAGFAELAGPLPILIVQSVMLTVGGVAFAMIRRSNPVVVHKEEKPAVVAGLVQGAKTVWASSVMRVAVIQNVAMACFFMGSFIVCFPLVIREVFDGSSQDLAVLSAFNSAGLVASILVMLKVGYVARPGRALILAQFLGAIALLAGGLSTNFAWFVFAIFCWGVCGGVAIPMSRTLMQEIAPANQRSRVMSFYAFSFMGAGPLGTLLAGYLAGLIGPKQAIVINAIAMAVVVIIIVATTKMWSVQFTGHPMHASESDK
ncbi:MAG: MFS transporter [Pseudomonadota bacterium]